MQTKLLRVLQEGEFRRWGRPVHAGSTCGSSPPPTGRSRPRSRSGVSAPTYYRCTCHDRACRRSARGWRDIPLLVRFLRRAFRPRGRAAADRARPPRSTRFRPLRVAGERARARDEIRRLRGAPRRRARGCASSPSGCRARSSRGPGRCRGRRWARSRGPGRSASSGRSSPSGSCASPATSRARHATQGPFPAGAGQEDAAA